MVTKTGHVDLFSMSHAHWQFSGVPEEKLLYFHSIVNMRWDINFDLVSWFTSLDVKWPSNVPCLAPWHQVEAIIFFLCLICHNGILFYFDQTAPAN